MKCDEGHIFSVKEGIIVRNDNASTTYLALYPGHSDIIKCHIGKIYRYKRYKNCYYNDWAFIKLIYI